MKKLLVFSLVILTALLNTTFAKGKKKSDEGQVVRILQANAISITVSFSKTGKDNAGAEHETYTINDSTVVSIDGHPTNARELRGGMVAHIFIAPDRKTLTKVVARDAPREPEKGHAG